MKKLIRYIPFLFLLLIMMSGFCACGTAKVTLTTNLEIKEGGSGNRQIKLQMTQSDMKKVLGGTSFDLFNEQITTDCPKGLEYAFSENGNEYTFTFSMIFDSMEEYKKQVESITGEAVKIDIIEPESVFATGFRYEEDFTSRELIGWVNDSLNIRVENPVNILSLITEDTCSVSYKDRNYSVDVGHVLIDNLVETPVERIDILSLYRQNQTTDREVIFTFSQESMAKNGDAIKAYFDGVLPEESAIEWTVRQGKQICKVRKNNMTTEVFNEFMKKLFSLEASDKAFISDQPNSSGKIFDSMVTRSEYIDLSAFTYANNESVGLGYYVQWEDGMYVDVRKQGSNDSYEFGKSDIYGGYQTVFEKPAIKVNLVTELEAVYVVSNIDVSTELKKNDNAVRKIRLGFLEIPEEKDQYSIRKRIAARAEGFAEVESSIDAENNTFSILITQSGSIASLNEGFAAIFGAIGQLGHETGGDLMAFKHDGTFSDIVDFTHFIDNESYLSALTYDLKLISGESITKSTISSTCSLSHSEEHVNSNHYSGTVNGAFMSLSFQTKAWNTDGVMLFVLILFCIIAIVVVFAIARVLSHMMGGNNFDDDDSDIVSHTTFGENAERKEISIKDYRRRSPGRGRKEEVRAADAEDDGEAYTDHDSHRKGSKKVWTKKSRYVTEEHTHFGDSPEEKKADLNENEDFASSDEKIASADQPKKKKIPAERKTLPDVGFNPGALEEEVLADEESKSTDHEGTEALAEGSEEPSEDIFESIETLGGSSLDVDPFSDGDDW